MIDLNNYIQEALIKKNTKLRDRLQNWSILDARPGDLVHYIGHDLFFAYKGTQKLYGDNAIEFYWCIYFDSDKKLWDKPHTGVGSIEKPENYELISEKDKQRVYRFLKQKGYKWDENKLELLHKI